MRKLTDCYLLAVVSHKCPKQSRGDAEARKAIAESIRKRGGNVADTDNTVAATLKLYPADAIASVMTHYHAFNTYHQSVTCEYLGRGARLLAIKKQKDHSDKFHEMYIPWSAAVKRFENQYPVYLDTMRRSFGEYFNADDYPDAATIARHFEFSCTYTPLADASGFELGAFTEEQRTLLEKQLTAAADRAANRATAEYRSRLQDALNKIANQMRNGKRLHDSLLTNLQELVSADLNATGDATIADALTDCTNATSIVAAALQSKEQADRDKAAEMAERISRKLIVR